MLGLVGGFGFEPPLCIYSLVVDLKVHEGLYLVCLTLHVREGVEGIIFILNQILQV